VRPKLEFNEFVRPACLSNVTMSTHLKSVSPLPLKYWPGKHVLETASYGLHLNGNRIVL
jgi:hypothetical protein